MDPHVVPFIQTIDQLHDDLYRAVESLTEVELNWRHPHLSNTIGILLRHIAGSERYWIVEVMAERPIQRQRAAEFERDYLEKVPLVEHLRAVQAEVTGQVARLHPADLWAEVEVPFRGRPQTFTKAWAILHSIQHTAYHLGQIQLFRKMATEGKADQLRPGR